MKKQKKILLGCIVLLAFLFVACGKKDMSNSKYVGTWKGTSAEYSGMSLSVEEIYGTFQIDLQSDGTVVLTTADDEKKGKWDESEDGVSLDDGDVVLTADGENLKLEQDGVIVTFEKQ